MILTGRNRIPTPKLRPLLLMIMYEHDSRRTLLDGQQLPTWCFGTLRLFVLGAQFDSARTSRLLFHPPRTSFCCVFLHLRTHPKLAG